MYIINIVTTPRSLSDSNLRAGSHPARTKGVRVICKPPAWPVSVKGVAIKASGRVVLLKNERQECTVLTPRRPPVVSHEHSQAGLFTAGEVDGLNMPASYRSQSPPGTA
jgi:hypothetical protein